jgi:putative hydrolase of the HAD superfamily
MSEEIDALLFDAGGTLIDLKPSKDEVFRKALDKHGFHVRMDEVAKAISDAERETDEALSKLDGVNEDPFWLMFDKHVLRGLGYDGNPEELSRTISVEFEESLNKVENWIAFPDARPLIEDLIDRRFRLGVVSNATELLRRVLNHLDLAKYFETIVISAEVGVRKPDARIFEIAVKNMGTPPNRAIYIGDKLAVDVRGASKAGLNAILLDRSGTYRNVNCLRVKSLSALRQYL